MAAKTGQPGIRGCAAAWLLVLLSTVVPAAWADVTLEANGATGTVQVAPGAQVDLTVDATACPAGDSWRDTWDDPGGIGVPDTGQEEFDDSPCVRSPSRTFTAPSTPGSSYDITFESEYCEDGFFNCPNFFNQYEAFDDSTVTIEVVASSVPAALLELRMDESAWNGTSGEVTDSSGNGFDGTARNGAQTDETSPAVSGDPGTCGYGTFDGSDDYVEVGGLSDTLNGTATLTFWIRTSQSGDDTLWNAPGVTGIEESGGADDIFWGWIDGSGRIGISVGNDDANDQKSGSAINDGTWHHVALTRDAASGDTRVYVDGVLETSGNSGTGTIGNAFSSIGRIEDTAGTPEYFQGDLDEVRVYDEVLTDSEVQAVFGDVHACAPGGPVAWYQLDELAYDGSSGEVLDASGNGNAGRTVGSVTAYPGDDVDAQVCSGATVADNTSTAVIDAIDTGVDVDADLGDRGSINFWYWSPDRWRQLSSDRMLLDASNASAGGGAKYFYLALVDATSGGGPGNRGARLAFGLEDDGDDDFQFETDRIDVDRETWVHIGITWDLPDDEMQVYVDGSLVDSWNLGGSSDVLGDLETLYLGDNRGNYQVAPMNGNSANGRFDEVRLYGDVIDAAQMAADRDATHPCTGGVDHYVIGHDGAGINCRPENVTLTAEDASGNPVTDHDGAVNLSTTTDNGDWSIASGNGTLTDGGGDDGAATYDFDPADDGQVVLQLEDTHSETLNIGASDGSVMDDDSEGDIVFRPYGFELTPDPIPTQVSGRAFDITLTAVGELPSDPGCNVIEEYDGAHDLKFWFDYEDPGSGTVAVDVDGTAIATSEAGAGNQSVAFTNGVTTLPVTYADAGEIQLHAQDDAGIGEPPAGTTDEIVAGGTQPFVVRPFGIDVSVAGDDNTTGPGGEILAAAGDEVDVTVRAVVWQSGDDSNNDGVPDSGADFSDNGPTVNFGNEDTPETVTLSPTVAAPGGSDGSLSSPLFSGFAGGEETHGVSWDEVGYVHVDAAITDGSYLAAGDVTGRADTVGRFIPADFNVVVAADGGLDAACNATYTYTGQAAGYVSGMEPQLTITARNRSGGTTTNYRDGYVKLSASEVTVAGPTQDRNNSLAVTPNLTTPSLVAHNDGTLTYTLGSGDTFTYDKVNNARVDPFLPALDIDVTDVDDGEAAADPGVVPVTAQPSAAHEIRFGRLVVESAAGSELAPIGQPVRAEYWSNSTWQPHADDSCTSLALATGVQLDNDQGGPVDGTQSIPVGGGSTDLTTNTPDPVNLAGGEAVLTFEETGDGNTGWVDTTLTLDAGLPWLRHDWDDADGGGDGPYDDLPVGRVTFGIYSGNSNWIHFRRTQ